MSDGWSYYKEVCECGCAKATHYFDDKGPGDCLGARCDCKKYRPEGSGEKNPKTSEQKSFEYKGPV